MCKEKTGNICNRVEVVAHIATIIAAITAIIVFLHMRSGWDFQVKSGRPYIGIKDVIIKVLEPNSRTAGIEFVYINAGLRPLQEPVMTCYIIGKELKGEPITSSGSSANQILSKEEFRLTIPVELSGRKPPIYLMLLTEYRDSILGTTLHQNRFLKLDIGLAKVESDTWTVGIMDMSIKEKRMLEEYMKQFIDK